MTSRRSAGADGARPAAAPGGGGPLVVGLGNPDRGDDAIGPEVAVAVAARGLPHVAVITHEDPTDLIELWSGHDPVVVIDAIRSGAAAGTLLVLEAGAGLAQLRRSTSRWAGRGGSHAFGAAEAIELARALHRLPPRLTLVGIEARAFEHGAPLSPEVVAALPGAVDAVVAAASGSNGAHASRREGLDHVPG